MSSGKDFFKWLNLIIGGVLKVGILCLCVGVLPVMAQQPSGQSAQTATAAPASGTSTSPSVALGNISVVGTRIRSTAVAQPRPIVILTAKQIQATGLTNVGQILQHITSSGTSVNSRVDVGGTGATTLDLRNLGSNRLLVLVNGKRWITSLGGSVDLDQIPTSVIQSIQVLEDGASAIYGSDAIAGVVNIITKKQFDGAQASAYLGEYNYDGHWDGQTQHFSYTMGAGGDKANVVFNIQYQQNDSIPDCARAISCPPHYGIPGGGSSISPYGRFEFYPPSDSPLFTNTTLCPPDNGGQPFCDVTVKRGASYGAAGMAPGTSISDYKHYNSSTDSFNYSALYDLVAPNQSTNIYLQGSYNLNPDISFHSTAMYNRHFNVERYSPRNLVIGAGSTDGSVISATNPYNPFGLDLDGNAAAPSPGVAVLQEAVLRPLAGGYRNFTETDNTFYYNGGFNGSFNWGSRNFIWNADYVFGRELSWQLTPGGRFNFDRLQLALGPASNCGPNTPNPGCVPFDFFGSAEETPAMFDYVVRPTQSATNETLRDYEANLSSGDILDLPGGPLAFNVGYEYRQLEGDTHPDTLDIATQGSEATSGGYTVKSLYGELNVPLLANIPLVKEMGVDLAVRRSKFSTFGTNTTRQWGFKWQPNNQLLLRASWAQGFRAPSISELFSPQNLGGGGQISDPCDNYLLPEEPPQVATNCKAAGVPATYHQPVTGEIDFGILSGGNPDVQPETSRSRSYGFVLSPDALPGFNLNADYFKVNVSNLISSFGALNVMDACYIGGVQKFCNIIQRDSKGNITLLVNTETNIGDIVTSGIDVGVSYAFTTGVGSFDAKLESTFTRNYDVIIPNGLGGFQTSRERGWALGQNYDAYPQNKSVLSVNWALGNWTALWRMRYISHLIEDCSGYAQYGVCSDPNKDHLLYNSSGLVSTNHLGATTYVDAAVNYTLDAINSTLTLGANNLFSKEPPISYTAHNLSFIPTLYDIPGRFIYFRISTKF